MQMAACNRFDGALQFGQGEGRRHQFENDRPIFEFRPQSTYRRRQNAAVIVAHRLSQRIEMTPALRRLASVPQGLGQQARLIEKFIAFESVLLVEAALLRAKQRAEEGAAGASRGPGAG